MDFNNLKQQNIFTSNFKNIKKMKTTIYSILALCFFFASCQQPSSPTGSEKATEFSKQYPLVPKDELMQSTPMAKAMYDTLTKRYLNDLAQLKLSAEALGAKILFALFNT